jgi:hypothetical protein
MGANRFASEEQRPPEKGTSRLVQQPLTKLSALGFIPTVQPLSQLQLVGKKTKF